MNEPISQQLKDAAPDLLAALQLAVAREIGDPRASKDCWLTKAKRAIAKASL